MPLDPDVLKARWGVTDPALDPLVDMVAEQAQALCETYCDRKFDYGPDAGDFQPVNYSFQVRRYPIDTIDGLWFRQYAQGVPAAGSGTLSHAIDADSGIVFVQAPASGRMVHCQWTGGFHDWPPALAWAITEAADSVWNATPGGGAPAGTPGGSLGPIKRLSVPGVFSAEMGGDASAGGDGDNTWGILPPSVTSILDRYRVAAVLGIG